MSKRTSAAIALCASIALMMSVPHRAGAQESSVIATVNGVDLTANEVALAAEVLGEDLQRIPENLRITVLVDILVNQHLLAEAAKQAGVEETENYKVRQSYYTSQSLRDAYVETVLVEAITEEDVEARYKAEMEELPEEEEVRARHILVETEPKAKTIARIANNGADFAELAKANSTGPSAPNGGDLDYFTIDRMVPEFAEAAFALKVGEISEPVESKFGWHVIKLEDRRTKAPPSLESVHDQMKALVLRDRLREKTAELREAADLSYPEAEAAAPAASDGKGDAEGTSPAQ